MPTSNGWSFADICGCNVITVTPDSRAKLSASIDRCDSWLSMMRTVGEFYVDPDLCTKRFNTSTKVSVLVQLEMRGFLSSHRSLEPGGVSTFMRGFIFVRGKTNAGRSATPPALMMLHDVTSVPFSPLDTLQIFLFPFGAKTRGFFCTVLVAV